MWKLLKRKMFTRKEQLTSLQQTEAIEIRRKSDAFGVRVEEFRRFFQTRAPFTVPVSTLAGDAPAVGLGRGVLPPGKLHRVSKALEFRSAHI